MLNPTEPIKKSLTQQALDQLPQNELRGKVSTDDGKTVDTKVTVQRTFESGVSFGFFVEGKFRVGQKPQGAAGLEIAKKWGN
jgi:hypothetical protein